VASKILIEAGGGILTIGKENAEEVKNRFYSLAEKTNFLFAVGDGNHSLASAKAYWEEIRDTLSEEERQTHPARYALCEVENLYDDGIIFEPIHRFVFGADGAFEEYLKSRLGGGARMSVYTNGLRTEIDVPENSAESISSVQKAIEEYVSLHPECSVDYIHGEDNLMSVASREKGAALVMPSMRKQELFSYVETHGALCKKTFSMGEAQEKRYYVEAKRI